MNKRANIKYFVIIVVAIIGFKPFSARAATVYLESSRATVSVGDTVIVSAKINAEGVTINTVEGDIAFQSGGTSVAVKEFSLANSAFGLWPRTPSLSQDGQVVSFVGGVPGGFNIEGATLFKIILQAKKEGSVTIAPQNIVVYVNDGKGTKLPVKTTDLVIKVNAKQAGVVANDEWGKIVAQDTTPPQDFIIVLGQDKTIFDNKKFAFFSALDNQSGIAYYEVSENGAPAVHSGSTYILQNQNGDVTLNVTAYDKAGNKKTATYSSRPTTASILNGVNWLSVIITVLVIIIIAIVFKKIRRNKNNVSNTP
jgi:hypothetical protein